MTNRRSYRGLMRLPAWGLYDASNELVATVRAETAWDARDIFLADRHVGVRVRRVL